MKQLLFLLSITMFLMSCEKNKGQAKSTQKGNPKIFNKLDYTQTGVSFSNSLTETDSLNYFTYGYMYMGGGVSAGDINNDGLIDLFFTGNLVSNRLYLNKGNLKFEDISKQAGVLGDSRWFTGVTMADVNNDGYLDIYCSVGGKFGPKENLLYINNKDNTFTESASSYGISDIGNSIQASFFDYDLDGDLDLYVANYPPTPFSAPNHFYDYKMKNAKDVETDKLFRNDGEKFTNVTDEAGLRSYGLTNSVTVADLNNDGWQDLYISNDFSMPDYIYINNKNGTFTSKTKESTKQTALYGMGVDIADFNNDGLLDIIQMDMTPDDNRRSKVNMASMNAPLFWSTVNVGFGYQYMQNMLQLNNGMLDGENPNFSNISRLGGLATTDWSWGPLFADLDNDGWKDIFIANGTRREINNKDFFKELEKHPMEKKEYLKKSLEMPSEKIDNYAFKNNGDLTFTRMNKDWGIEYKGFSNGAVYADLDNDGDLEIIINNIDDVASVFENTSSKHNNYITLRFKGTDNNKFGLGVKATLKANHMSQYQEMTLTRGFQSSVAPQLHFGLGKAEKIDSLFINWPDGKQQILTDVDKNQVLEIDYKQSSLLVKTEDAIASKLFTTETNSEIIVSHQHVENLYNDFDDEILLPYQPSMLGPNVAVGDLNNDGLEDFIISGSKDNQAGVFYQTDKGFIKQQIQAINDDSGQEDMGALIFDADKDGDNDIYMISAGNEFDFDSEMLQDRFYVNDGKGDFTKSTTALPKMLTSGSRVFPFDYDKDGDLDLFVSGRQIPKHYPQPADSYILENVSTKGNPKFKNVTKDVAPELEKIGMVTSASWTDIDKDGWTDLVIVGEWMPITIFKNNKGTFKNRTKAFNLENSTGWWFSVKEGDFDKDGDIDFIVGNNGLNFKYKANPEETFDVYFNDFDNNKHGDIVLSYFNEGTKYPLRGRQCSSDQIPAIKKKFKDYETFSIATLEDVYTKKSLEKSLHYQVKSFASVYLENKGGEFILHSLPNLAQVSAANQVLVKDFDQDSNLDVVLVGNLYMTEVETPRNDAGIGIFLKGDGKGNFIPVEAYKSGLYVPGDVKDLATIKIQGKEYIIVTKNYDYIQFVKIGSK